MIAVATQSFALDKLPFGWFDVVLVALLGFGLFRGRRNGMTKEVVPMFQMVATVLAGGLGYETAGQLLINTARLDKTLAYILGYVAIVIAVHLLFILVKKTVMPRLTGSNFFGSGEYYLGMAAGMIRYVCMLFVALALLNAPIYTAADIANSKAYNARWYGGGQAGYSGDFFPTIQTIQEDVFRTSFTGKYIKQYAGVMLVNTSYGAADKSPATQQKQPVLHIGS